MLGLPISTEISKQLPKKAIYAKFDLKPAQRDHFDADISKLTIVNDISTTTIPALQDGKNIHHIYVIEIILKNQNYDPRNIQLISKMIAQNIIFAMRYENLIQLSVYHTIQFTGIWLNEKDYKIELKGLNLDKIWENIVADIGNFTIEGGTTLDEQISINNEKTKLLNQIASLEKKMRIEKQSRKKLEYFDMLSTLKGKIKYFNK